MFWTPAHPRRGALRPELERLRGLPIRPATARACLTVTPEASGIMTDPSGPEPDEAGVDPGWVLTSVAQGSERLRIVEECPWWAPVPSRPARAARETLWRHAVALSRATERLAIEDGHPDPPSLARLALLVPLGLWAIAAVSPENLAGLIAIGDPDRRREAERALLGNDAAALGRDLAEAWGLPDLLADAAWLYGDTHDDVSPTLADPRGLDILQRARNWAERTPWAIDRPDQAAMGGEVPSDTPPDDRVRLVVAEVQALCAGGLRPADAGPREERLTRAHAGLLRRHRQLEHACAAKDQVFQAIAEQASTFSGPIELPEPSEVPENDLAGPAARLALASCSRDALRRDRLVERLDAMTEAYRRRGRHDEAQRRFEQLDALAEFAAGAAHELNNPLAVILGRAQLLLTRRDEGDWQRSLRAIIGQARRAHRMLRDLMYVARPAEPRPRPCQPDAIARSSLADLAAEAASRGVTLVARIDEPLAVASADPDGLRQLAEALLRNAIEATPPGGSVTLIARSRPDRLDWTIRDQGQGLDARACRHLLDPFFCGREAGRGLGLGLSRAARYVELSGGRLRWRSSPGRGTTFRVTGPLPERPLIAARVDETPEASTIPLAG